MKQSSIGIIGGADGPTKIFLAGNPLPEILTVFVIAAIFVVLFVVLKKKK